MTATTYSHLPGNTNECAGAHYNVKAVLLYVNIMSDIIKLRFFKCVRVCYVGCVCIDSVQTTLHQCNADPKAKYCSLAHSRTHSSQTGNPTKGDDLKEYWQDDEETNARATSTGKAPH